MKKLIIVIMILLAPVFALAYDNPYKDRDYLQEQRDQIQKDIQTHAMVEQATAIERQQAQMSPILHRQQYGY